MATQKSLAIFGGAGFLGTKICQAAIQKNWKVVSISRSGEPDWKYDGYNGNRPAWAEKVTWVAADIFEPAQYKPHLKSADAVVHSMGLLLEADYKNVLSGKENPISGLKRAFGSRDSALPKSPNPLDKVPGDGIGENNQKPSELTYEKINRDSALVAAKQFVDTSSANPKTFVYISASAGFPILPKRYITTKRETEELLSQVPDFRTIAMRPSFMYSPGRKVTMPISYLTGLSATVNKLTGKVFGGLFGAAGDSPVAVEKVGQAVVQAIDDESIKGPVEVSQIETLATRIT